MPTKIKNKTVAARPALPPRSAPIIERAPLPIVEVQEADHIISYVNSAFCSLIEKSREQLLGKRFSEIVPRGHDCVSVLDQVYKTGEAVNLALEDPSEQTPAHWLYAMWPVVDEAQLAVGVIIQLTKATQFKNDVTAVNEALLVSGLLQHQLRDEAEKLNAQLQNEIAERKVADSALRQSEEKYRSMIESSRDCIKELDLEGRVLSINGAGQCLMEIDEVSQFLHQPWVDFWKSDPALAQQAIAAALGGGTGRFEAPCETFKGIRKWWSVVVTPILNAKGQPVRLLVVSRDITKSKETEENLIASDIAIRHARDYAQATLRTAPIPLVVLQADLRVNTANEAFYKNFEVEESESEGQLIYDLGNGQWNIPELRQLLEDVLPKNNFFNAFEVTHTFESIGRRTMLLNARRMENEAGRPPKIVLAIEDITERKQAEEALREAQVKLKEHAEILEHTVEERTADLKDTNEQLEAFVYSIAHDLRAPLRSMQGFSQVLLDEYAPALDAAGQDFLKRINRSSEFMDKMILDLLSFGQAGRTEIELVPVNVRAAWNSALFQHFTQIKETQAEITTDGPFPSVLGNEALLAQILANLLSNAIKFVPPNVQPKIRFWAEVMAKEKESKVESRGSSAGAPSALDSRPSTLDSPERVRLWIEDNGVGIPAHQHERVFRVFERLFGGRFPGTGIGLSIVRKGIERLNGTVGLESDPDKGTRFWIELAKA